MACPYWFSDPSRFFPSRANRRSAANSVCFAVITIGQRTLSSTAALYNFLATPSIAQSMDDVASAQFNYQ
jgi:hypothetical protein